jgi:hypothetical protein
MLRLAVLPTAAAAAAATATAAAAAACELPGQLLVGLLQQDTGWYWQLASDQLRFSVHLIKARTSVPVCVGAW